MSNKFVIPEVVYERLRDLPQIVRTLCFNHQGWVVGSKARYLTGLTEKYCSDWDVIVPVYLWMNVTPIIPYETPSNSFGGFKVSQDGHEIDVWPEDLGHYFMTIKSGYEVLAVQPRTQQVAVGTQR